MRLTDELQSEIIALPIGNAKKTHLHHLSDDKNSFETKCLLYDNMQQAIGRKSFVL